MSRSRGVAVAVAIAVAVVVGVAVAVGVLAVIVVGKPFPLQCRGGRGHWARVSAAMRCHVSRFLVFPLHPMRPHMPCSTEGAFPFLNIIICPGHSPRWNGPLVADEMVEQARC